MDVILPICNDQAHNDQPQVVTIKTGSWSLLLGDSQDALCLGRQQDRMP